MCLYPTLIKNKRYLPNKKNGGLVPRCDDDRKLLVPVGCGKCIECAKKQQREWQVRLLEDIKEHKNGKFVTLTLSNEAFTELALENEGKQTGYELDNWIAKTAVRRFLERWRKKHKKSVRHWLVTELGHNGTENIHLHGIIWTNEDKAEIEKNWKYGFIWCEDKKRNVGEDTINYCIKYISKQDFEHQNYKPIILTSSGIGRHYTKTLNFKNNKYKEGETNETYRTSTGHRMPLPIYLRNKRYTEDEREKLWIEKLNKEERFICGEKVNANEVERIEKLQQWHRARTEKLGYPNIYKIWKKKEYEELRRTLLHKERMGLEPDWTQLDNIKEGSRPITREENTLMPSDEFWKINNDDIY